MKINNNLNSLAKRTSISGWITLKEFEAFRKMAIWAVRETDCQEYKLLIRRIKTLVETNGFNFTFKYLKECLRLVVLYLAGTPNTVKERKAPGVRVNQYGLPVIIPAALRRKLSMSEESRTTTRCILTLLSIFRTFPTKVKPDLGSITNPFTGITKTLEIGSLAVKFIGRSKLTFGPIRGFISESAGPVAKKATWGAPLDALALIGYPKIAYRVLTILWAEKAYIYMFSLIALWIINGPLYVLMCTLGVERWFPLGRLSVVYDQAGKARIVAMANWWIQLVLRPLHLKIFKVLESYDTDGTHNQDAPLSRLMDSPNEGHKFSCFDLSAATDRLPIDLQVTILNSCGVNGEAWKDLVVGYPYYFKGQEVRYAVGQPMGAYSSWAMLALTHHLIVKLAAVKAGKDFSFSHYALLGDDIVINDDHVAKEYINLMDSLGVQINMSKSVISNDLAEFAKRLVSPKGEVSPIGAGNILISCRRPYMLGSLLAELYNKSIVTDSDVVVELLSSYPRKADINFLVLWTYFGSCRHLYSARLTSTFMEVWNTYGGSQLINFSYGYHLYSALRTTLYDRVVYKAVDQAISEENFFWKNFYKLTVSKGLSNGFYESLGLIFSPALYLYGLALLRATENAKIRSRDFMVGRNFRPDRPEDLLAYTDFTNISVKWSKRQAKEYGQFVKSLTRNLESLTNESYSLGTIDKVSKQLSEFSYSVDSRSGVFLNLPFV